MEEERDLLSSDVFSYLILHHLSPFLLIFSNLIFMALFIKDGLVINISNVFSLLLGKGMN